MIFNERKLKSCVQSYLSSYRWKHILRVEEVSKMFLVYYPEADSSWLVWAVYAHDATKEWSYSKSYKILKRSRFSWVLKELKNPFWHGYTAVLWLEKKVRKSLTYELEEAIRDHTLGAKSLPSPLAQLLFVSDFLDPVKLIRKGKTLEDFWKPSLPLGELYQKILLVKQS